MLPSKSAPGCSSLDSQADLITTTGDHDHDNRNDNPAD
jgi:hypothetical protein